MSNRPVTKVKFPGPFRDAGEVASIIRPCVDEWRNSRGSVGLSFHLRTTLWLSSLLRWVLDGEAAAAWASWSGKAARRRPAALTRATAASRAPAFLTIPGIPARRPRAFLPGPLPQLTPLPPKADPAWAPTSHSETCQQKKGGTQGGTSLPLYNLPPIYPH